MDCLFFFGEVSLFLSHFLFFQVIIGKIGVFCEADEMLLEVIKGNITQKDSKPQPFAITSSSERVKTEKNTENILFAYFTSTYLVGEGTDFQPSTHFRNRYFSEPLASRQFFTLFFNIDSNDTLHKTSFLTNWAFNERSIKKSKSLAKNKDLISKQWCTNPSILQFFCRGVSC